MAVRYNDIAHDMAIDFDRIDSERIGVVDRVAKASIRRMTDRGFDVDWISRQLSLHPEVVAAEVASYSSSSKPK